jgi:preprotein translocase subunit YajC
MGSIVAIIVIVLCVAVIFYCLTIYRENRKMGAEKKKDLDEDGEIPFTS